MPLKIKYISYFLYVLSFISCGGGRSKFLVQHAQNYALIASIWKRLCKNKEFIYWKFKKLWKIWNIPSKWKVKQIIVYFKNIPNVRINNNIVRNKYLRVQSPAH